MADLGGQVGAENRAEIGLTGVARRGEASWRGVAWLGAARRLGEAWRGVACRVVACRVVEGVKGVKGESALPLPRGLDGLALLKGVDRCEIYPPFVEDLKC